MIDTQKVYAYRFRDKNRKAVPYWRDVGTLDAYYQANMDLVEIDPGAEPLRPRMADPHLPATAAAAQVRLQRRRPAGPGPPRRSRMTAWSARAASSAAATSARSILSPNVRVNSYALVENSILFDGVDVGRHCQIRKAIIDKDVQIPPNTTIGYDLDHDRQRGFVVTEQGVVVIAKAELPETFAARIYAAS